MAGDIWVKHDTLNLETHSGNWDIDTDVFKIVLLTSASNIATTSVVATGSVTGEVANGLGYTTGGQVLTCTGSQLAGVFTFTSATQLVWTATGGSLVARYAGLYNTTRNVVVAHALLDSGDQDVTVTDTNDLTLDQNASGIYTIT